MSITEKPYPLIGNLALGREGLGYTIVRIYETLDDKCPYFGVYMFHKPVFVAKDKELIKRILVKDFSSFSNRVQYANEKVDAIASNNLFTFRNDVWKFVRNKLTPVFTSGKLKLMLPLMNDIVVNLEDVLNTTDNQNVDIKDICKRFTTDITTSCAFGLDSGILKNTNSEIKEMTDKLLNPKGFVRRFAAFCWLLCPFLIDILRLPFLDPEATEYLTNVFKHSEDERKKKNIKRNDFVDLMMELSEQEMENDLYKFDDLKKSAQAMVFYNAGTESTSTTLSVCLYELALNPDVQEKLRHEIKENLDSQGNISYEKLHGMEYLDLVIKETLRKYPFAQFLSRYADNDYFSNQLVW
uniref:Cytochrome P450 345D2 n=1 Tax=Propylea japonica TaxID=158624 RepID=A0A9E7V383_9CUCU|nr:cytochrome P450 345D2 [Propylea japonica]